MSVLSAIPGSVAVLLLIGLLVWVASRTAGRRRTFAVLGVGLHILGIAVGVLFGLIVPLLMRSAHVGVVVGLVNGMSLLLAVGGVAALLVAVMTPSETR